MKLVVVSSSLLVLVACAACTPRRRNEASSSNSGTSGEIGPDEVSEMKMAANPCFYGFVGDNVELGDGLQQDDNIAECMENFESLVEHKLYNLGKVGDAMRTWMELLDEYENESPSDFASFMYHYNLEMAYSFRTKLESIRS